MGQRNKRFNLSVQYSLNAKITFNINLVGKKAVGKSSLVVREIKDTFGNIPKGSEGFQFYSKTIRKKTDEVSVQIWDTAGKSEFNSMTRNFFRKAVAIILVYENTDNLEEQVLILRQQLNQYAHESAKICLIRTKTDSKPVSEEQRQRVREICEEKLPSEIFYRGEVSAKNNQNVHEYFNELTDLLFKAYEEDEGFRQAVLPTKDSFCLSESGDKTRRKKRGRCC